MSIEEPKLAALIKPKTVRHPNSLANLSKGRRPDVKFTDEQRAEICRRYAAGGVSQLALALEYDVSQPTIYKILHGGTDRGASHE